MKKQHVLFTPHAQKHMHGERETIFWFYCCKNRAV